jgi:hypothetical protein
MLKKHLLIFFIAGLFILFPDRKSYAADNISLMQCLMRKDKRQVVDCLRKEFPRFSGGYDKKMQVQWFDELLRMWQVLYGPCPDGMTAADCIASMDIRRCREVGSEQDDGIIGGFGKGTCYALAAFLKKNNTLCQNQFYPGTKMNCNVWLEKLSSDCSDCRKEYFIPEKGKEYFNYVYEDGTVGMEDIRYCREMSDPQNRDDCFMKAALVLEDASLCEQISATESADQCRAIRAYKTNRANRQNI